MVLLGSLISIFALFSSNAFGTPVKQEPELAIVDVLIPVHKSDGYIDLTEATSKKKIKCEPFSRKNGAGKVSDAHHITNYLISLGNKPYKFDGSAGHIVSLYKTAAVNVYLDQIGNATMTLKEIGEYGNSIIKACNKKGLTHGIQYVPPNRYKASGFHKDYESVYVQVAYNATK